MQFTTRQKQGVTIADLSGRLTAGGGDALLRTQIKRLLDGGVRSIVLNLAGLQMIDSSGVGELNSARKAAQAVGGAMKLTSVGAEIRRVMETARLAGQFEIFDDETSAVASF
jgi:anti-sigma B factor antagonist